MKFRSVAYLVAVLSLIFLFNTTSKAQASDDFVGVWDVNGFLTLCYKTKGVKKQCLETPFDGLSFEAYADGSVVMISEDPEDVEDPEDPEDSEESEESEDPGDVKVGTWKQKKNGKIVFKYDPSVLDSICNHLDVGSCIIKVNTKGKVKMIGEDDFAGKFSAKGNITIDGKKIKFTIKGEIIGTKVIELTINK